MRGGICTQGKPDETSYSINNKPLNNPLLGNRTAKWWMVYSLVVRACGLEYGGREFESRSLHLKPETKLREERGLSGCRKGLKTVPLAQALLSLKPAKTEQQSE